MADPAPFPNARLGPGLRRWRRLNNVKQAALAEDFGVSQATVSRWEAGVQDPEPRQKARLLGLLSACPGSASDRALIDLVGAASEPVHLICDVSHRLIAASASRVRTWRFDLAEARAASLWRFASEGIAGAEARLGDWGWHEPLAPEVTFRTERVERRELTIEAGVIRWTRMALSDGSFARLVRDGARERAA